MGVIKIWLICKLINRINLLNLGLKNLIFFYKVLTILIKVIKFQLKLSVNTNKQISKQLPINKINTSFITYHP